MNVWTIFILGLLVGWIVEWVIDWIYWRQRMQGSTAELESLRAQNSRLRADIEAGAGTMNKLKADLVAATSGMAAAKADNDRMRAEIGAGTGSLGQLKADLATANTNLSTVQAERDRLRIELEALRADRAPMQAELGAARGSKAQLLSTDPELAAWADTGVHLTDSGGRSETAEIARLHAELAAPRSITTTHERDPLIDINGIGPVYEQRLFEAGIYTFDDLAAQTPARLRELVGAKAWQEADAEAWIAEALQMSQAAKERGAP